MKFDLSLVACVQRETRMMLRSAPSSVRFLALWVTLLAMVPMGPVMANDDPIPMEQEGQVIMALKEANAQAVVESIAINGRYNFVTRGKIDQTVTVNLNKVTIQDALDSVTLTVGLEYRVQGRIITLFGSDADSSFTETYKFSVASVGSRGGPGDIIRRLVEGGADPAATDAAASAASGGAAAPAPEGGGGGGGGAKGRVIVDRLNNQLVVTAPPSVQRRISKLAKELDKPTQERGGRKARLFEIRYISPDFFRRAIQFEIPGFQDSQILLFSEGGAAGGAAGGAGGGAAAAAGGAAGGAAAGGGGAGGGTQLSTGELEANLKRVIISETEDNLNRIENLLKAIDRSPRQVFLDVKLVNLTLDQRDRFGAQLRMIAMKEGRSDPFAEVFSNAQQSADNPFKLKVGTLGPEQFQVLADYLQQNDRATLLSNPKLTVVDGRPASIRVVTQEPYGETTTNNGVTATQVRFLDIGITLNFTASIFQDNQVKLALQPEVSTNLGSVNINQNQIPRRATTQANTTLLVRNNHTVIIGGIISSNNQSNFATVPLLGHIPLLGRLFHRHQDDGSKSELIITITTKIVEKGDYTITAKSAETHTGSLKYFFRDYQDISNRILYIDEVVDH